MTSRAGPLDVSAMLPAAAVMVRVVMKWDLGQENQGNREATAALRGPKSAEIVGEGFES